MFSGWKKSAVNFATNRACVVFARRLQINVTPVMFEAAVAKAGYRARPAADGRQAGIQTDKAGRLYHTLVIALFLTFPVFILEMGGRVFPFFHHWVQKTIGARRGHVLQFVLTSCVLSGPDLRFFQKGIPALCRGAPDMNSLVP